MTIYVCTRPSVSLSFKACEPFILWSFSASICEQSFHRIFITKFFGEMEKSELINTLGLIRVLIFNEILPYLNHLITGICNRF